MQEINIDIQKTNKMSHEILTVSYGSKSIIFHIVHVGDSHSDLVRCKRRKRST